MGRKRVELSTEMKKLIVTLSESLKNKAEPAGLLNIQRTTIAKSQRVFTLGRISKTEVGEKITIREANRKKRVNEPMNEWRNERKSRTHEQMKELTGKRRKERSHQRTNALMGTWLDCWMGEQKGGQVEGRIRRGKEGRKDR